MFMLNMLDKGVNMEFSIEQVRKTTIEAILHDEKIKEQFDYVIDIINLEARKGKTETYINQIPNSYEIAKLLRLYGFDVIYDVYYEGYIIGWGSIK